MKANRDEHDVELKEGGHEGGLRLEADTDPIKEVLCFGATFAPTQQIMFPNLVQGRKP